MVHYKHQANIDPLNWLISSPADHSSTFINTMQASGHIGDLTLVEIVFVNNVNKGWVGVTQGDLHRKTGCQNVEEGSIFNSVTQENKILGFAIEITSCSVITCSTFIPSAVWWTWSSQPSGRSCIQPLQAKSPLLFTLWLSKARSAASIRWVARWSWTLWLHSTAVRVRVRVRVQVRVRQLFEGGTVCVKPA